MSLTLMFQITDASINYKSQSTHANQIEKYQNLLNNDNSNSNDDNDDSNIGGDIKNRSTVTKLAKSKKSNLAKS